MCVCVCARARINFVVTYPNQEYTEDFSVEGVTLVYVTRTSEEKGDQMFFSQLINKLKEAVSGSNERAAVGGSVLTVFCVM